MTALSSSSSDTVPLPLFSSSSIAARRDRSTSSRSFSPERIASFISLPIRSDNSIAGLHAFRFLTPLQSENLRMKRVISLLPSATEIVFALGLGDALVAVTHECDYPPPARSKPQVTTARINPSMVSAEIDALVREQLESAGSL